VKRICVITGSRADYGLLIKPIDALKADPAFSVQILTLWGESSWEAMRKAREHFDTQRPDIALLLGDRFEIMAVAMAAHLARVPIAHIAGGDVTEGSYDDAMRDCISRMATLHFTTSTAATARLSAMGYRNVHLVGSPGIDYIMHGDWRGMCPYPKPYVVVSYQCETIDGTNEIEQVLAELPDAKRHVVFMPNADSGSQSIRESIQRWAHGRESAVVHDFMPHDQFLNLLLHCDEFIGNSSAILYEAPTLGIKTLMIGKRQRGRTVPMGDGHASERIRDILKRTVL